MVLVCQMPFVAISASVYTQSTVYCLLSFAAGLMLATLTIGVYYFLLRLAAVLKAHLAWLLLTVVDLLVLDPS